MRGLPYAALAAFVATVVAANWALETFGVIPIGLGLMAPAGVFFAGLAFGLRDYMHETLGRHYIVGAILAGAVLSYYVSDGVTIPGGRVSIAVASGTAFLLSELADYAVYAPVRRRTIAGGIVSSQAVGATVDSALFLFLAFGSMTFFWGQFVGKMWMTVPVLLVLVAWRARKRYVWSAA